MKFIENKYNNYVYLVVSLNYREDKEIIDFIAKKAQETAKKVNQRYLNGRLSTPQEKFQNNLGGILAEEVVKEYLRYLIKINKIDAEVLDTEFDNYKQHRDIKVRVGKKVKTIEIRSSFNYIAKLDRVLNGAFSLLGRYITSYKQNEPEKDYYITVLHRYNNNLIIQKIKDEIEVFIIGGASKEKFKEIGKIDKIKLKQNGAIYEIISPIISSPKDVLGLFMEILEII